MSRAGDGIVDFLGETDERKLCRVSFITFVLFRWQYFNASFCIDSAILCNLKKDCSFDDDEQFCTYKIFLSYSTCTSPN
ncbi:hypothetical protein I4U23_027407 [Adineta vaga]|nr:hypothetical protein I4U23_027407 [Adineta vaga]